VVSTGNTRIILTERVTSFGYNNLVVGMRGLADNSAGPIPIKGTPIPAWKLRPGGEAGPAARSHESISTGTSARSVLPPSIDETRADYAFLERADTLAANSAPVSTACPFVRVRFP
jgi:2-dehydro-3-deoxyphosphooctonate aldolase (KDO 8-P synthase)